MPSSFISLSLFLFHVGLVVLFSLAFAKEYAPRNLPSPKQNPGICSRKRTSAICDPDRYLTYEDVDKLDELILSIQEQPLGNNNTNSCNSSLNGT